MNSKKVLQSEGFKIAVVIASCLAVAAFVWFGPFVPFLFPGPGKTIIEKRDFQNHGSHVLVTAYAEKNSFSPGAYYVFDWIGPSNERRHIMTFRHDDPVAISQNAAQFVNDRVAFVYMGWTFAVTTDGGASWSVWDAEKDLPGWKCCNYRLIEDVNLNTNGRGVMRLKPIQDRPGEVPELRTIDYGKHWQTE